MWVANGVVRNSTRGSTGVDHMQSEWHVTGTSVTWDFRGGSRTTCRGKSRGDGWDCYTQNLKTTEPEEPQTSQNLATTLPTPQTITRTPHSIPRQASPIPGQQQTTMSSTTKIKSLGTPPEA